MKAIVKEIYEDIQSQIDGPIDPITIHHISIQVRTLAEKTNSELLKKASRNIDAANQHADEPNAKDLVIGMLADAAVMIENY